MAEWGLEMKVGGIFLPHLQSSYMTPGRMVIRTDRDPQTLVPAIKAIVRRVNPEHPFPDVTPLQAEIDRATAPRRFVLRLIGMFSFLGLVLAVIGIYGVLAESVAERVPEIGVRIALGARPADVVSLIMRQAVWMVAGGLGLGLAGAVLVSRQMRRSSSALEHWILFPTRLRAPCSSRPRWRRVRSLLAVRWRSTPSLPCAPNGLASHHKGDAQDIRRNQAVFL